MDDSPEMVTTDPEMRQLLGLFDVPAYARRGQELEFALDRLHARCRREREAMMAMVRLRARQWASVATGPEDGGDLFASPMGPLWEAIGGNSPSWADAPGTPRRRGSAARDLAASIERFNRRWTAFLADLKLSPINQLVDHYNRYYLLEKECAFGSARVAARHFRPRELLTADALLGDHPLLPALAVRR